MVEGQDQLPIAAPRSLGADSEDRRLLVVENGNEVHDVHFVRIEDLSCRREHLGVSLTALDQDAAHDVNPLTHGTDAGPPTVAAPGPLLPFDGAVHTLASAANRKARSAGSVSDAPPPIE